MSTQRTLYFTQPKLQLHANIHHRHAPILQSLTMMIAAVLFVVTSSLYFAFLYFFIHFEEINYCHCFFLTQNLLLFLNTFFWLLYNNILKAVTPQLTTVDWFQEEEKKSLLQQLPMSSASQKVYINIYYKKIYNSVDIVLVLRSISLSHSLLFCLIVVCVGVNQYHYFQ